MSAIPEVQPAGLMFSKNKIRQKYFLGHALNQKISFAKEFVSHKFNNPIYLAGKKKFFFYCLILLSLIYNLVQKDLKNFSPIFMNRT